MKNLLTLIQCIRIMRNKWNLYIGVALFLNLFVDVAHSQQTCPPPDVPHEGNYFPNQTKFQPGDKVTYSCNQGYTLMGKETNKCKSNGDWLNSTPFCDCKAPIKNVFVVKNAGNTPPNILVSDNNTNTCVSISTGEAIVMTMEKPGSVFAVRMFLQKGNFNFEITIGSALCSTYGSPVVLNQWVLFQCIRKDVVFDTVRIQDKSRTKNNSTLCEIEIYVREEEGCEYPPDRKVANGYFEVTRSLAELVCENGYQSGSNSARLVCEKNVWVGSRLQCNEILCNPVLNTPVVRAGEWVFLDPVRKISAGTRQILKCSDGHKLIGSPDVIVCQKNGVWTETNATCSETSEAKTNSKIIILGVGSAVMLIIIALLATTIYYVKKQRREIVVVYNQPTEGCVSGSESEYASASVYYESIRNTVPQPPTSKRPVAQLISDEYFAPADSQEPLKKRPMPADIAFDYALPYQHI